MKFDTIIMNPPYGEAVTGGMFLDMQFVKKVNEICNTQVVIHPATRFISDTKLAKTNAESGHLKELYVIDANKEFDINTGWKYAGIYVYDNTTSYDTTYVKNETNGFDKNVELTYYARREYYDTILFNKDIISIVERLKKTYNELLDNNGSMVNDNDYFIYEENRLGRGKRKFGVNKPDQKSLSRVKEYLKDGKYKYCLYKGSYNNDYDEVQEWKGEDPDKLFKGQICWLTNKENVKNNIKYWMECPLFDLWRRYKFGTSNTPTGCLYGYLPALNFNQSESEFKEYVDSLNDFTEEEIKILKDNNIHNANKL